MTAAPVPAQDDDRSSASSFRFVVAGEMRAHLARRQISNRRLAAMLGTTPAWIDRRLNGTTAMSVDDIETFANALGMSAMRFLSTIPTGAENGVTYHGSNSGNPHGNVVDLAERRHASGPIDQVEAA